MAHFDFTPINGQRPARPSAARIVSAWKTSGRPHKFVVEYGETYAEFERLGARWQDSGNGCRGVDRAAVVKKLQAEDAAQLSDER